MNQKTHIDATEFLPTLVKIVKSVAKAAGGTVLRLPTRDVNYSGKIEVDSIPVDIYFQQQDQRLKASVASPQYIDERGQKQTVWIKDNVDRASYCRATTSMRFALDRPPEAIARSITSRLVPDMKGFYDQCVKICKQKERYYAEQAALLSKLAMHFRVQPRGQSLYLDSLTLDVSNNGVTFNDFFVSADTAKKIVALIQTDRRQQRGAE